MAFGWLGSWVSKNVTGKDVADAPPPPSPEPMDEWSRIGRMMRLGALVFVALGLMGMGAWYVSSHRQFDWAVIVVAGDWRAHDGSASEGFDNARHDVAQALHDIGFNDDYMMQFSVRPELYPGVLPSTRHAIGGTLADLTSRTSQGCLLYFSSHGAPSGMILGQSILSPLELESAINATCGDRPTVIIVSACYSGAFVPALEGNDRVVITAARADRTSFGCGQADRYPYFDGCVLQEIKGAHSFPELGDKVRDCVAQHEQQLGANPPSDPQVFVGADVAAKLPTWN